MEKILQGNERKVWKGLKGFLVAMLSLLHCCWVALNEINFVILRHFNLLFEYLH
jgi:hypothetical protein